MYKVLYKEFSIVFIVIQLLFSLFLLLVDWGQYARMAVKRIYLTNG